VVVGEGRNEEWMEKKKQKLKCWSKKKRIRIYKNGIAVREVG